jgi:hypothetical protein
MKKTKVSLPLIFFPWLMSLGLILGPLLCAVQTHAQASSDAGSTITAAEMGSSLFIHTGPFLAARAGLREQLPMFGGNYSFKFRETWLDTGVYLSELNDTRLATVSLGFRHNFSIDKDLNTIMLLGGDWWYIDAPRASPRMTFGMHIGGGVSYALSGKLAFRTDSKINIGPGFSLYIGLGLEYYFDDTAAAAP